MDAELYLMARRYEQDERDRALALRRAVEERSEATRRHRSAVPPALGRLTAWVARRQWAAREHGATSAGCCAPA